MYIQLHNCTEILPEICRTFRSRFIKKNLYHKEISSFLNMQFFSFRVDQSQFFFCPVRIRTCEIQCIKIISEIIFSQSGCEKKCSVERICIRWCNFVVYIASTGLGWTINTNPIKIITNEWLEI